MKIVISQPMFFPWPGLFEQVRLADVFVHYDDVQFPQGRSFINRVQVKTSQGVQWLTVPVQRGSRLICDVLTDESQPWREKHLATLQHCYSKAPFFGEMMDLARGIYAFETHRLSEINIAALEAVCSYFDLEARFLKSSEFSTSSSSSQRLLELVLQLRGTVYITGHGARNYLDHELFERQHVSVEYMNYLKHPYPQLHGPFTPFVSILDVIANCGRAGRKLLNSPSVDWKEFLS